MGDHGAMDMVALSDEELAEVSAGDFELRDLSLTLNRNGEVFDVNLQNNVADRFTLDIAQGAFNSAQGVFTTLQTVNSAVDLSVVVNIFFNGQNL